MLIKAANLTDTALAWAVAKCAGDRDYPTLSSEQSKQELRDTLLYMATAGTYSPSTNWAQGGPICEKALIAAIPGRREHETGWTAWMKDREDYEYEGQTELEAKLRCYVASKLGDKVEIPDALCNSLN